ncbi:unnamed protein product [Absidia cylindrospora]
MSLNAGVKTQGKKQDVSHSRQNQSRGNKKWTANNSSNNNSNSTSNGGNGRGGNYHTSPTANNNTNNNNANGPGQQQHGNNTSSLATEDTDLVYHMHDRMSFLLGNLYGSNVQVTVRNGTRYEGIFQGATTEGDLVFH